MARSMKDVLHESYQMSLHETKKNTHFFQKRMISLKRTNSNIWNMRQKRRQIKLFEKLADIANAAALSIMYNEYKFTYIGGFI